MKIIWFVEIGEWNPIIAEKSDWKVFKNREKKKRKENHNNVFVLTGVNAQFFVVSLVLLEWKGNNLRG